MNNTINARAIRILFFTDSPFRPKLGTQEEFGLGFESHLCQNQAAGFSEIVN
jgi:hypothetical protein